MSVGENIRGARERKGLSQKRLGLLLGVSNSTISDWERGKTSPDTDEIYSLCVALEVSANVIIGTVGEVSIISPEGRRIAMAYDKAASQVQKTVDVALEPWVDAIAAALSIRWEEEDDQTPEPEPKVKFYDLPASAGGGEYLAGDGYTMIDLPRGLPATVDFGVRVSGQSMEPRFHDGDIAWVKETPDVPVGQIGVFVINGEGYIKQVGPDRLISLNPAYDDIAPEECDDVRTCGLVVAQTRDGVCIRRKL